MKALLQKYLNQKYVVLNLSDKKQICVVSGYSRSGTSVACNLVKNAGFDFGSNLREANKLNPKGFFENKIILETAKDIMKNSGYRFTHEDNDFPLQVSGVKRMNRMSARIKFSKEIKKIACRSDKIAFKYPPHPLHIVSEGLPNKIKFLAIFRNPIDSIYSNVDAKTQSFSQTLRQWKSANLELIYHVSRHNGLLIDYDDLTNYAKQSEIIRAVARYLNVSYVEPKIVDNSLNRSSKCSYLHESFILDNDTISIYQSLKNLSALSLSKR